MTPLTNYALNVLTKNLEIEGQNVEGLALMTSFNLKQVCPMSVF